MIRTKVTEIRYYQQELADMIKGFLTATYQYTGFGDVVFVFNDESTAGIHEINVACSQINQHRTDNEFGSFNEYHTITLDHDDLIRIINKHLERYEIKVRSDIFIVTKDKDDHITGFEYYHITCKNTLAD